MKAVASEKEADRTGGVGPLIVVRPRLSWPIVRGASEHGVLGRHGHEKQVECTHF